MDHSKEIYKVKEGSIAWEMGIEAGDILLAVNNEEIKDIFDYQFLINDEYITVLIRKPDGEEWELEIEKDFNEDLGIEFEQSLMDEYKSCRNKCIFCFIDQLPKGMRDTLYFKDDDSRLSFLQGNYVTLTNMKMEDIDRLIRYRLEPINVSVHTTNPKLRCKMLNNRFAGDILKKLDRLYEGGIELNGQIVCCKGYNDGEELIHTIRDLSRYIPVMKSLSVVPFGMTKFREGLAQIEPFNKEDSKEIIEIITGLQEEFLKEYGTRFVYASDEWYINSGIEMPKEANYEGYPQIENGVGMVRSLIEEVIFELGKHKGSLKEDHVTIITGTLVYENIKLLADMVNEKYPNIRIDVIPIVNDFFGHHITVAGLLTGQDIIAQLKNRKLGYRLLMPQSLLRSGEDVLLDDMRVCDIESALQIPVDIVKSDGKSFVNTILGMNHGNGV